MTSVSQHGSIEGTAGDRREGSLEVTLPGMACRVFPSQTAVIQSP